MPVAPIKMAIRELSKRARAVMSHERIRYKHTRCGLELEFHGQRGTGRRTTCPGCEEDLERDDNAAPEHSLRPRSVLGGRHQACPSRVYLDTVQRRKHMCILRG